MPVVPVDAVVSGREVGGLGECCWAGGWGVAVVRVVWGVGVWVVRDWVWCWWAGFAVRGGVCAGGQVPFNAEGAVFSEDAEKNLGAVA